MKQEPELTTVYGITKVIDTLFTFKMESKEFLSNEKIISSVGKTIDNLNQHNQGHVLLSIVKDKVRNLLLILKLDNRFSIYKWKIIESIDKAVAVEIYEEVYNSTLNDFIANNCSYSNKNKTIVSSLVIENLTGFATSISSAQQLIDLKTVDIKNGPLSKENFISDPEREKLLTFGHKIISFFKKGKSTLSDITTKLVTENKININLVHDFNIYDNKKIFIGQITKVKEIGGMRHFEIDWISFEKGKQDYYYGKISQSCTAGVIGNASDIKIFKNLYKFTNKNYRYFTDESLYDTANLNGIPYNLIDKNRIIIGIQKLSYIWETIISPDPKIDSNYKETLEKEIEEFIYNNLEENYSINNSYIEINEIKGVINYAAYESDQEKLTPNLNKTRLKLKTLKTMIDECNYIIKKNKAIGNDVTITENIKYNHDKGKISYNDFSIEINDEYIKSKLYNLFNNYLLTYYREENTEQDILDLLLKNVFELVNLRLNTKTKEHLVLPIKINNNITITVTTKISERFKQDKDGVKTDQITSTGQLFYINDIRFNKNEVLMVLKEITCYRSQEEANNFISNIGRLGLSVYIGISTGYEVTFGDEDNKLFRFKKLKGRSNYQLLLDDTNIPIKGKKLLGMLYENFIGSRIPDFINKIPACIYEGSGSCNEYLKYKVLIDSTYKAFKDRSKEYLDKKVKELNASYVKYYNKKSRLILDAIKIKGSSGKDYIIAYNNKDSYVFMDPDVYSEENTYKDGKYICMIDQSNIKSNISYDTIVSKLLALKNDSIIAHTIYNLEEELQ